MSPFCAPGVPLLGNRARLAAHVGQDGLDQALLKLQARLPGRLLDGQAQSIAVQGANQELLRRDTRRQVGVRGALRVEVRPQGQDHGARPIGQRGGVEQVGQESGALRGVLAQREYLLELIHDPDDLRGRATGLPRLPC